MIFACPLLLPLVDIIFTNEMGRRQNQGGFSLVISLKPQATAFIQKLQTVGQAANINEEANMMMNTHRERRRAERRILKQKVLHL